MRKRYAPLNWPRRDPRHYRFPVPNAVWEYKLRPVEFVIFSYPCYHRSANMVTPEVIAIGTHMTAGTVKKYLTALTDKGLIKEDGTLALTCEAGKYFTLPNEMFLLRLPPSAFMVYAYLLLIEDRRTHTCHPSYNTIAAATGLSKNTSLKSVGVLAEKGLITVEPSSYFDQRGMKWKGNNLYTILLELSTGLRRGEICALQWNDLNFRTGELRVERQVHRVKGELVVSPPKTKASNRSVILPAPVLGVLRSYRETVTSKWMFPSPVNEDSPKDPATVRKRLQTVLERAECKKIRFHDLRHTFSTVSLEHGMDIKTLSTIIGHVSSSTTLNVYAHITDEMRRTAAAKIDQGIGKAKPHTEIDTAPRKLAPSTFKARKGQRRKAGTGCVTQINEKLWEGRYSPIWPDGKKHAQNVYAHNEDECERLLAEMIAEMKMEITAEKGRLKAESKAS